MSASATKSEFATFLARMDKWESTKHGSHSNLRDTTKKAQRRIAGILSSLTDDETMIALDAFRACTSCDENKREDELNKIGEGDGISPRFRRWQTFVERHTGHKSDYQHAEYYALLAPVWNALNGRNGKPWYCMGQAIYTIRDETNSMSITSVTEGDRAGELRNKLIGTLMYNDALGVAGFEYDDVEWFGANWERIAPVWQMLKTGNFDRNRVEAMIDHKENGGAASISSGVL
jgi:hypothetical protein